jgi:hypothetical protein
VTAVLGHRSEMSCLRESNTKKFTIITISYGISTVEDKQTGTLSRKCSNFYSDILYGISKHV